MKLNQVRQVIKHHTVRVEGENSPALPSGRGSRGAHGKQVELLQVQGRVRALQFRCACGETTVIELEYPDEKKA